MELPRAQLWRRRARIFVMLFGVSQIRASCAYSPPPLPSQGQGADTLGERRAALAAEAGYGTVASWWNADNLSDPDVNSGVVGAGRLRLGLLRDLDVGLVGAAGPESAFVLGPEAKWRFSHFAATDAADAPGFHASLVGGLGLGAADLRYGGSCEQDVCVPSRHFFAAPYLGVLTSGGIEVVQMFVGLRVAGSEALGNGGVDLTVYPTLSFGVEVHPSRAVALYAEGVLGAGVTTNDVDDTAVLVYPSAGLSVTLDDMWGP